MPIKKRKIKFRPVKKVRKKPQVSDADIARMGELIAAGHGTEEHARIYYEALAISHISKLQSIVAKASKERSWKMLNGCFKQAMELYVFASILYEKYPEHVIMSDNAFDSLAKFLLRNWKKLDKDFCSAYNLSAMGFKASTGFGVIPDQLITWMIAVHTGDNTYASDTAGPLQRDAKRGRKQTSRKVGKPAGRVIRRPAKSKRRRASKAG